MSREQGFCHCPICKYWVPAEFMLQEYDYVEKTLTRMCYNCARDMGDTDLPSFEHLPFRYDPEFGLIRCPMCGHKHPETFEYNSRAKAGDPEHRKWHCGHCGRDFRWFG